MARDDDNMAEAAALDYERGAAADYAGVVAQERRMPRHCHWCGWQIDTRIFYMADPLKRCLACGLWLCAVCDYAHDCAGLVSERRSGGDGG